MMTNAGNVGEGWHQIIHDLEAQLNAIDPNFEIQQVKEKFGGLRYYASLPGDDTPKQQEFHRLIAEAEEESTHTCEVCGKPGETTPGTFGWLKTLCPEHKAERLARDKEMMHESDR